MAKGLGSLSVALLLTALVAANAAQASFPGQNGRIAFRTERDGNREIYSMNPDGTDQQRLTNEPTDDGDPAWSRDGAKIVFSSMRDNVPHLFVMDSDGSDVVQLTDGTGWDDDPSWSPDSTQVVFRLAPDVHANLAVVNADGTGQHTITGGGGDGSPAWSPDDEPIAFTRTAGDLTNSIWTVRPDGSNPAEVAPGGNEPDWSPDHTKLVFGYGGGLATVVPGIGSVTPIPNTNGFSDPVWSPDGTRIAAVGPGGISTMNVDGTGKTLVGDGSQPNWQPLDAPPFPPNAYPRPRGASPTLVSLVPHYLPCVSSNNTHGAPLAFPSCSPPQLGTFSLTMGTPDANGQSPKFVGSVLFKAIAGKLATTANEADVRVTAALTDVRCKFAIEPEPGTESFPCRAGELADYTGELEGHPTVRITDRRNGYRDDSAGTVQDLAFPFTIPCAETTDTSRGADCGVSTTFNSVVPGTIQEGARSIWQLEDVDVYDGGIDGIAATRDGNGQFVTEGIFIP